MGTLSATSDSVGRFPAIPGSAADPQAIRIFSGYGLISRREIAPASAKLFYGDNMKIVGIRKNMIQITFNILKAHPGKIPENGTT